MATSCYRCARCAALSRTWGPLRFSADGPLRGRPICRDAVACTTRKREAAPGEIWLEAVADGESE